MAKKRVVGGRFGEAKVVRKRARPNRLSTSEMVKVVDFLRQCVSDRRRFGSFEDVAHEITNSLGVVVNGGNVMSVWNSLGIDWGLTERSCRRGGGGDVEEQLRVLQGSLDRALVMLEYLREWCSNQDSGV